MMEHNKLMWAAKHISGLCVTLILTITQPAAPRRMRMNDSEFNDPDNKVG